MIEYVEVYKEKGNEDSDVRYVKENVCFINQGDEQTLGYVYQRIGDNNVLMVMDQDEFLVKYEKTT